jgi:hypothetical protein
MNYASRLITSSLTSIIISCGLTINSFASQAPLVDMADQQANRGLLTTVATMTRMADLNEFQLAIELDVPGWRDQFRGRPDPKIFDAIAYCRHVALAQAYQGLAKSCLGDIPEQTSLFHKAVMTLNDYVKQFDSTNFYGEISKEQLLNVMNNRIKLYIHFGDCYSDIYPAMRNNKPTEYLIKTLNNSIGAYTRALERISISQNVVKEAKSPEEKKQLAAILEEQKLEGLRVKAEYTILQHYCSLAQLTKDEKHLQHARAKRDLLKTLNKGIFRQASEQIVIIEKTLRAANVNAKAEKSRNPKVKQILKKKVTNLNAEIVEQIPGTSTSQEAFGDICIKKDTNVTISEIYQYMTNKKVENSDAFIEHVCSSLAQIEAITLKELDLADFVSRADQLYATYVYLMDFFGQDNFFEWFPKHLFCLSRKDNYEGAIERLEILKTLYLRKYNSLHTGTRVFLALAKLEHGELEEWIALENEAEIIHQEKQDNHARQAEEQRRRYAAGAKAAVELAEIERQELARTKQAQEEEKAAKEEARRQAHAIRNNSVQAIAEPDQGEQITEAQRRQAKLANHLAAEEQRKQPAAVATTAAVTRSSAVTPRSAQPKDVEDHAPDAYDLTDLYNLTGVAKMVEWEISQNTWHINREQLETYFMAMGGIKKKMDGSHSKIKLPNSTRIEIDGKPVVIFIDEGGSIHLPLWDDVNQWNNRLQYLKPMVLKAREHLARLAMKARESNG